MISHLILPYLHKNGLYPTKLYFRTAEFREALNFPSEDTIFMVIMHGLTRFSSSEINNLIDNLAGIAQFKPSLIIMSDIMIKTPAFKNSNIQFIHYTGDLFFGRYTCYMNNKPVWSAPAEGLRPEPPEGKNCTTENRVTFWAQFAEFTEPKEPMTIGEKPFLSSEYTTSDTKYIKTLIDVDLFKETVKGR